MLPENLGPAGSVYDAYSKYSNKLFSVGQICYTYVKVTEGQTCYTSITVTEGQTCYTSK